VTGLGASAGKTGLGGGGPRDGGETLSSVLTRVRMRSLQAVEHLREHGWTRFRRDVVSLNRKAIVVTKDLGEASFASELFRRYDVRFLDVTPSLIASGLYRYAARNRYFKALEYLGKGYGGHALSVGGRIVGDAWYCPTAPGKGAAHPDLRWLGLVLGDECVYSFDIHMAGEARGHNLSAALQNGSMYLLGRKGFRRAYAYYWADNTPAVWNTRVINRWKEQKSLTVRSVFLHRKVVGQQLLPGAPSLSERNR
jgi:hypothetical protein